MPRLLAILAPFALLGCAAHQAAVVDAPAAATPPVIAAPTPAPKADADPAAPRAGQTVINFEEDVDASVAGPSIDVVEGHPAPAKFKTMIGSKYQRVTPPEPLPE